MVMTKFFMSRQQYNYEEAKAICKAYDSELATYDQIEDAYNKGANWCSYGWSEGQLALFLLKKMYMTIYKAKMKMIVDVRSKWWIYR